jgi:hypothetical protein
MAMSEAFSWLIAHGYAAHAWWQPGGYFVTRAGRAALAAHPQ